MSFLSAATTADDLHESGLVWQDLARAKEWDLGAAFIEEKTRGSSLAVVCSRVAKDRELSAESWGMLEWCLGSGGSVRKLEQESSALFFELARARGAERVWRRLIDAGYSIEPVAARFKESGFRTTTKLGLICSAPYCSAPDLAELIRLLSEKGVDPNARDSDGISPLGRLNEQLKNQEAKSGAASDVLTERLLRGADALLEAGAEPESILPAPEMFAAEALRARLKAALEKRFLTQEIQVREHDGDDPGVESAGRKAL